MSDLGKDSLEKAAGEGLTMELDGKTYNVTPFTIGDFSALRKFIKSQRLQEFIDVSGSLPSEDRRKIILDITTTPVSDELLLEESASIPGITFLLSRSLRAANPGLTEEELNDLITKQLLEENKDLLTAIQGLNGGEESENPPLSEERS